MNMYAANAVVVHVEFCSRTRRKCVEARCRRAYAALEGVTRSAKEVYVAGLRQERFIQGNRSFTGKRVHQKNSAYSILSSVRARLTLWGSVSFLSIIRA